MNVERAKRREKIAVAMMAALCSPQHTFGSWEDQAHDALAMANALMAKLDDAALADTQDDDPLRQLADLQDLLEAKDAAANRSVAKSILIWQRDRQIADLQDQLAALKQREKGGDDRDIVIEANAIQNAALNGIVKVREDQVAELERKLATLTQFVDGVRGDAEHNPELYAPFVALLRDLDAKVGAK